MTRIERAKRSLEHAMINAIGVRSTSGAATLALCIGLCALGCSSPAEAPDAGSVDSGIAMDGHTATPDAAIDSGTMTGDDAGTDSGGSRPRCGNPGMPCCPGETCGGGGCCVDNQCITNGGTCADGLGTCTDGSCGGCGASGETCCMEIVSDICSGVMANCPGCTASGTTCQDGSCVDCGSDGQRCCGIDVCLDALAVCSTMTCTSSCGHPGEPCCQGQICRDGGCCLPDSTSDTGLACVAAPTCGCTAGACTTCGVIGLPCCPGDVCAIGQGLCQSGMCMERVGP